MARLPLAQQWPFALAFWHFKAPLSTGRLLRRPELLDQCTQSVSFGLVLYECVKCLL